MIGEVIVGEYILGEPDSVSSDYVPATGRKKTEFGCGFLGSRIYSKGEDITIRSRTLSSSASLALGISNVAGALIGKIRTDVEKPVVESLEFTLNSSGGCAEFTLSLNRKPPFPLRGFTLLIVNLGDTEFDWYTGLVSYPVKDGTDNLLEYKGQGPGYYYLSFLKAFTTYTTATDIGTIIRDIAENHIAPYCPINYNESKIPSSVGVLLANDVELGKYPVNQILDIFAKMAGYEWGVDGDLDLYFEEITDDIVGTIFVHVTEKLLVKENVQDIKNVITAQRQQGLGSGGVGWAVAGVYVAQESIDKYGRKEYNPQLPGSFGDDDIAVYGQALLDEYSEPRLGANITGLNLKSEANYYPRGNYRVIMNFREYEEEISDVNTTDGWSGDLTAILDTTVFMTGTGAVKFLYDDDLDSNAVLDLDFKYGKVKKVIFYIRSSRVGKFLTFGVGVSNWNENTIAVSAIRAETWLPIEWDVEGYNLTQINKFGFKIDDSESGTLWIDGITGIVTGNQTYIMRQKRSTYKLSPSRSDVELELGALPAKLPDYIAELKKTATELRFTQEIRA